MNPSQLAYRHQPLLFLITGLALIYGILSYFTLPAREDPEITIREGVISTSYPGLPAEQVEEQITKPLEVSVRQVREVERIHSTSRRGQSQIHVEIRDRFFRLDPIWEEVKEQVEATRAELPEGTGAPVLNDDFGDVAVVTAALMADDFTQAEQLEMAEHIRARLYGIEGTKRVDMLGVRPRRIHLDLSEARMAALGLSPSEVAGQLQSRNVMPPAGVMETGGQRLALQVSGEYPDIESLRATEIRLPGGGTIRLGDLGDVERGYAEPVARSAYFNGKQAIVLAISMLGNHSVLDYGEAVKQRLDEIRGMLPAGYKLEVMTFQAEQVANAVYGVTSSVIQTLLIVLAVVMILLVAQFNSVKRPLLIVLTIPLVIVGVAIGLLVLQANFGFMVLLGVYSLAGIITNNAIVLIDRIDIERRDPALSLTEAIIRASVRRLRPIVMSTVTTILGFLTLIVGRDPLFYGMASAMSFGLALGTFLSLGVVPVLYTYFFPGESGKLATEFKPQESIS